MITNDGCVVTNGNVVLVDPNCVNTEIGLVNEMPDYEQMYLYVDLTATRRGRTVLQTGFPVQTDGTVSINMMGFNQDEDTSYSSHGMFTTNYYDGSTGERKQYESFGIENIKVTINSSFIPQVNITFVDIRGLSFFNNQPDGEDSPYRILFDFPPPIFNLTLKGYYGRGLSYKLHLVKYTTDFKSDNGNFYIDAQFVALTFAPLADILFRYVINFPLIEEGVSPEPEDAPTNTFDLITKVHRLNHAKDLFDDTDVDNDIYEKLLKNESGYQNVITTLAVAPTSSYIVGKGGSGDAMFLIHDRSAETENVVEQNPFRRIDNISGFNDVILSQQRVGVESSPEVRLYLAFELGTDNLPLVLDVEEPGGFDKNYKLNFEEISPVFGRHINKHIDILNDFRDNQLIRIATTSITDVDKNTFESRVRRATYLRSNYSLTGYDENSLHTYVILDITDLYVYLYKGLAQIGENKGDTISALNTKINNLILTNLGMKPTIYNVFKIILNDVDKMFRIMRDVSYNAEKYHHNVPEILNQIVSFFNYRDVEQNDDNPYIYSYPLVIDNVTIDGVTREERVAPIKISESLGANPFPELVLVHDFIDSFRRQSNIFKQMTLKLIQNLDGSDRWIPTSPFDSKLNSTNISTPYFGIDNSGSVSNINPTPLLSDSKIVQIMTVVLRRYYLLSQYVYPVVYNNSVDENNSRFKTSSELMNFFADSEAINLANSLTNSELKSLMLEFSKRNADNVETFNGFLNTNMNNLYNLNINPEEAAGTNVEFRDYIREGENIYVNKNNPNYVGCKLNLGRGFSVSLAVDNVSDVGKESKQSDKRIYEFTNNIKQKWYQISNARDVNTRNLGYLNDNLFYVNNGDDVTKTKFILNNDRILVRGDDILLYSGSQRDDRPQNKRALIDRIVSINQSTNEYNGNSLIRGVVSIENPKIEVPEDSIVKVWTDEILNNSESYVEDYLFNPSERRFATILLLSNLGYNLSMFNFYQKNINNSIFSIPAVIQLPEFLPAYIGALIDIEISEDDETYQKLREFFIGGGGNDIDNGGIFIFADIVDIKNCLSEKDKQEFRIAYENFTTPTTGSFDRIIENLRSFYGEFLEVKVQSERQYPGTKDKARSRQREVQRRFLTNSLNSGGNYHSLIIEPLMRNVYLLNFSELTFKRKSESPEQYVGMSQLDSNYAAYFREFFKKLKIYLKDENSEQDREDAEARKLSGDRDIINQTYYSFKNINDKWIVNPQRDDIIGFPFNEPNGRLIDLFAFVDRAMNPAGDTIINPEILADLMDDPNVTLFGVLSQLLSSNGFEFFPLQNFMSFESDKSWQDSFKIDETGKIKNSPNFVCMYIGGSSRYVSGIGRFNNFADDGIIDLSGPGLGKDFVRSSNIQNNPDDDNQRAGNVRFPWGEVRAFRVRFAEQNQSMFKDIKIESKEFPETNESIQILSRLAGDSRANAPVPKGQNLYNLYENRAYSATITGLGNMMIQPTQYFQLENVPLYNGAYMILNVEHEITANKMNTSFTGTKILKYPIPRVTNPASILGFDEGDTEQSNPGLASQAGGASGRGTVSLGGGTNTNPDEAKYYSMYEQKIEE